jgi:hypothetical protein
VAITQKIFSQNVFPATVQLFIEVVRPLFPVGFCVSPFHPGSYIGQQMIEVLPRLKISRLFLKNEYPCLKQARLPDSRITHQTIQGMVQPGLSDNVRVCIEAALVLHELFPRPFAGIVGQRAALPFFVVME